MGAIQMMETVYAAAAGAGLLQACTWQPAGGSPAQTHPVGFSCPDDTVLDGLTGSTEYVMTFPASDFAGLSPREQVQIAGATYLVREVVAVGDGSERRARLTKV